MSATIDLYRKLASSPTSTSFTAKIPIATKPSGDLVVDTFANGIAVAQARRVPKFMQVIPICTGGNNKTFDMRVWGWAPYGAASPVWVPTLLLQLNVVAGNIAGDAILASSFLADTLTIDKGDANAQVISPANDTVASALVHIRGNELIEFDFDADAGASASTADNVLYRFLDQ